MEILGYLLMLQFLIVKVVKGQCLSNGTCDCHCVNCNTCTECLPGWSGSVRNKCQRANILYQGYGEKNAKSQILDDDLNTFVKDASKFSFVRVQLRNSTQIDQVDITLFLRRNTNYTFYVKEEEYVRENAVICDTLSYTGKDTKRTITMNCRKPLTGTYLEIVPAGNSDLQVFEIQQLECTRGTYGENCTNICQSGCDKECDKRSGACLCKKGFYGKSCGERCSPSCDERGCNLETGDCLGCKSGFFGEECEKNCSTGCQGHCNMTSGYCRCKSGFFTANCSLECSLKCYNKNCDQTTGSCFSCVDGYYGKYCEEICLGQCNGSCDKSSGLCEKCSNHSYGHLCNLTCPKNCKGDTCDRDDGDCKECRVGYKGNKCNEKCPRHCQQCKQAELSCDVCERGYYGLTCSEECPASCGGNKSCEIKSGDCHLCSSGYYGSKCDLTCSRNCDLKRQCDKNTGKCERCIAGRYGDLCKETCSNNCLNVTCFNNQTCVYGCKDGWFGEKCNKPCIAAIRSCTHCIWHGETRDIECQRCGVQSFLNQSKCYECPENCSSCVSKDICTQCKSNYFYGVICEKECDDACKNNVCDMNGNCLYGCNNRKYGRQCDQNCPERCRICYNASQCFECDDGYYGARCQRCQENCKICRDNVTCDVCTTGWSNQSKKCKNYEGCLEVDSPLFCAYCDHGFYGKYCMEKCKQCVASKGTVSTSLLAVFLVFGFLLLLSGVIVPLVYIKLKWKCRRRKKSFEDRLTLRVRNGYDAGNNGLSLYNNRGSQALLIELDPDEDIEDLPVPEIQNHNYLNVKISRIFINTLWEFTIKNKANDYLREEFQDLPEGLLLECRVAKKAENKKLNRYKHIYPYDITRVVLNVENGSNNEDYINACYVNGFEKPREYIAAQGPFTDDTIHDFWRMIWQLKVNTIVILTNLEENKIMKCKKYWPKHEKIYGELHVTTDTEDSSTLFTVRRLMLFKEGEERKIEQFHFTAWPDKGVPRDVNSILEFRNRVVNKADISGPIAVHCSAGIGRTGTFIAIDYLIKQGQRDGSVDVVSCVSRIRHQRAHAIQTVEQYIYLYDVITKGLTGYQSTLLKDEFRNYFSRVKLINPSTGKQHIEEEFQLVEKLVPDFDEKRYRAARALNNRAKNRHNNILPDDKYRIHLIRGESDYINAIQMPDAQRPFGYIITQTPLPNTLGDFLSLVADHEVFCIVMFEQDLEETVGIYLPTQEGPIICDSFELFLLDKSELGDIDVLTLNFHDRQTGDVRSINVFLGNFWKQNRLIPDKHQPMIDLVEAVLNHRKEYSGHPVMVHCMNGAKQSGMFCVLANLVEQIQLFGTVDILQTVLNMRHRRSQIVPCLEQLEYIYDFVANYLESIGQN